MKITMYELLGMVKDGKAPKKIIYDGYVYELNEGRENYEREIDPLTTINWDYVVMNCLNEEVEVCSTGLTVKEAEENFYKVSEALYKEANKKREKKIPEKLKILNANEHTKEAYYENYLREEIALDIETLQNWVNKIIDYLKSKGE